MSGFLRRCLPLTVVLVLACSVAVLAGGTKEAQEEKVSIKWVFPGTADVERDYAQKITEAFNAAYPDINLSTEFIGWNEVMDKVIIMVTSGNPPDMLWASVRRASELQNMGALIPIEGWLKDYKELDQFYPYLIEGLKMKGELYSLPTMNEIKTTAGQMRVNIIKSYWGDFNNIKSWDDFLSAVKACNEKDADGDGKADTWGIFISAQAFMPLEDQLESFVRNNGPLNMTQLLDRTKKQNFVETIEYLKKLSGYTMPGSLSMQFTDRERAFADERVAIIPGSGSWVFGNSWTIKPESLTEDKLGTLIGPVGPSHKGPAVAVSTAYGPFIFNNIPDAHKEASWKFVQFQANRENSARFPAIMHVPARKDTSIDDVMRFTPYPPDQYRFYIEMYQKIAPHAIVRTMPPAWGEMTQIASTAFLDLYRGEATAEQTYEKIYREVKEVWKSKGYDPGYVIE